MSSSLRTLLREKRGHRGIYSVCSASPWVIQAAMQQALPGTDLLLIEATSNQVNQQGGYTGMQPKDFVRFVYSIAQEAGFPVERLILGGDHLGPNAWQHLPASEAMSLAETMMAAYAEAGFQKIHLDASMRCADDPPQLADEVMAERAARLCAATEAAASDADTSYVVGTEVPTPGGANHSLSTLEVTSTEAVEHTLAMHQAAFERAGLQSAWDRVIAVVVQPGVEFDHNAVIDYAPEKAAHLQHFLQAHPQLVMEAHSTDYQRPVAFQNLVRDGFAILKVGPALTFAQREALFALEAVEQWLVPAATRSHLRATVERAMLAKPKQWQTYYQGTPEEQAQLRVHSYSDRVRYYWNEPEIEAAVDRLIANLRRTRIPETLLSQHLPQEYLQVRGGLLNADPAALVHAHIRAALDPYRRAALGISEPDRS
ncbi:D-tagatose-bisphosphate aldolase, class II, non-catalytic subunit [Terriglobus sp.]|uniref:D-tagatose-bisphosphate aldolase, class II, non-catalytic subunit n=1 Tax=Terriglobus sp. TaxID=1889013 RepID=UPI003B002736